MKRLRTLFAMLAILLFTANIFAQSTVTETIEVNYYSHEVASTLVDSTGTAYSNWFSLRGYETTSPYITQTDTTNGLATTFVPDLRYSTFKITSVKGVPKVTLIVEGTNDTRDTSQYFLIDTLSSVADSVETWQYKETDFGGKRFLFYRYQYKGEAANRADTRVKNYLYYPKKKFN